MYANNQTDGSSVFYAPFNNSAYEDALDPFLMPQEDSYEGPLVLPQEFWNVNAYLFPVVQHSGGDGGGHPSESIAASPDDTSYLFPRDYLVPSAVAPPEKQCLTGCWPGTEHHPVSSSRCGRQRAYGYAAAQPDKHGAASQAAEAAGGRKDRTAAQCGVSDRLSPVPTRISGALSATGARRATRPGVKKRTSSDGSNRAYSSRRVTKPPRRSAPTSKSSSHSPPGAEAPSARLSSHADGRGGSGGLPAVGQDSGSRREENEDEHKHKGSRSGPTSSAAAAVAVAGSARADDAEADAEAEAIEESGRETGIDAFAHVRELLHKMQCDQDALVARQKAAIKGSSLPSRCR